MQFDASTGPDAVPPDSPSSSGRVGNCLLLTSDSLRMLVPRTLVAEVLGPQLLQFAGDEASGLLVFGWRGRRVPLLDSSVLGAAQASDTDEGLWNMPGEELGEDAKIALFYGIKHPQLLPFYGVSITHNPRLLRVSDGDLEEITGVTLHPAELMRIRVEGVEACIPRVDHIESALIDAMKVFATSHATS